MRDAGTLIVLLLCVLVFRALATHRSGRPASESALAVVQGWATEVVDGARTLVRLDAARRRHLDRPPWG